MVDEGKVHVGKVVGNVSPLRGMAALTDLVDAARECFLVHEQEATKRERMETYRATERTEDQGSRVHP